MLLLYHCRSNKVVPFRQRSGGYLCTSAMAFCVLRICIKQTYILCAGTLTSAKCGLCKHAVVEAVLATLSCHVLGEVFVMGDRAAVRC